MENVKAFAIVHSILICIVSTILIKVSLELVQKGKGSIYLFCFCGRLLSKELGIPIGILPMSGAGVDGNATYQAKAWDTNKLPTS